MYRGSMITAALKKDRAIREAIWMIRTAAGLLDDDAVSDQERHSLCDLIITQAEHVRELVLPRPAPSRI